MIRVPENRLRAFEDRFFKVVGDFVRPHLLLTIEVLEAKRTRDYTKLDTWKHTLLGARSKTAFVKRFFKGCSSLRSGTYRSYLSGKRFRIDAAEQVALRGCCHHLLNGDNLRNLLLKRPSDIYLESQHAALLGVIGLRWWIDYVFDYKSLFQEDSVSPGFAYEFSRAVGLELCPYCNRMYTHTVERVGQRKLTRPQFDHYFSQSVNPFLSVSMYNLVPACSVCNHIKRDAAFSTLTHVHPYVEEIGKEIRFSVIETSSGSGKYSVQIVPSIFMPGLTDRFRRSADDLGVLNIYASHSDEIGDVFRRLKLLNRRNLDQMRSLLGRPVGDSELLRFLFGVYMEQENWSRRPFSKLIYDMIVAHSPELVKDIL